MSLQRLNFAVFVARAS